MNSINVLDIETYGQENLIPYCIVAKYQNIYYNCVGESCVKAVLRLLFSKCTSGSVFYAHNLTFDGIMLLNFLPDEVCLDEKNTMIRRGSIYSLGLVWRNKIIVFKCSAKLLPLKLKEIAEKLNLPLKLEFDHKVVTSTSMDDFSFKKQSLEYCKRDVEITFKFLRKLDWSLKNSLPYWKNTVYTISGLALKIFLRRFNEYEVNLRLSTELDEKIRPAYYGGRCEVFGNSLKSETVYHYDFSGMYSNRLKEKYPIGEPIYTQNIEGIEKIGFYYVSVISEDFDIPILPYRAPITGKLLFPNGEFNGLYWYEELKLFVENGGTIKKIHWAFVFVDEAYTFKTFAEHCIIERKKSKIDNIIWKLIPNSFVGRLGLKYDNEHTFIIDDNTYDPRDYNVISDRLIHNSWLVRVKTEEKKNFLTNANVIYAAITTSKARILWWRTASNVTKAGGRVLYCDTDSLFVAFKENIEKTQIGEIPWEWEKNDTYVKNCCFFSSKFYYLEYRDGTSTLRLKGVPRNRVKDLNFQEIQESFYNSTGSPLKFKFLFFNKKSFNMKIEEIEKEIGFNNYDKRLFSENKKTSSALII